MAVVNPGSVGFGASCVERSCRDVRGLISCGLPERVSSGKACSSGRVLSSSSVGKNKGGGGYSRVSDFVIGSIKGGGAATTTRCSILPGDGGNSKNLGISSSSKNLRWVDEDVVVSAGGVDNGAVRNISVVQALAEDAESASGALVELLDSDRPHPISSGGYGSVSNQLSILDGAMGGNEVQTMTAAMYRPKLLWFTTSEAEEIKFIDRTLNALLAGAAISYAFTKIVTVDHDVWHGWTMFEVLKYAPLHNWHAYEEVLKSNPILAKMMISGIVYSIGDWIGQVMYLFTQACLIIQ